MVEFERLCKLHNVRFITWLPLTDGWKGHGDNVSVFFDVEEKQ
jgi:hypothetical protein